MLTPSLAQEIAQETASVTGLGILITDPAGIVIGSSDRSRIGTFHEASLAVISSHEPASHTIEQAARLAGVRPGLTLPILVQGDAVGTVGITGRPARVRGFGPLVRRHTEILLHESATLRSRLLKEHALEDLVREIGAYDPSVVEPDLMLARARDLGYDLRAERVAVQLVVLSPTHGGRTPADDLTVMRTELVRTIRERFSDPADIVAASGSGRFVALRRSKGPDDRDRAADTNDECLRLLDTIKTRLGLRAMAGIGPSAAGLPALQTALQDAADAVRLGVRARPHEVVFDIADLRTHQLLARAPIGARDRLVRDQLTALVGLSEWPSIRATLIAWCDNGFNLVATARALHVHRNTVVYRLARVEEATGRRSRDHNWAVAAYLACICDLISE